MKVIEGPAQWSARLRCRSCDRLVEVEPEDLVYENHAVAYAGETDDWYYVVYCTCGNVLSQTHGYKIPDDVLAAARKRAGRP